MYGLPETLYNRLVRWSLAEIFNMIFRELAKSPAPRHSLMNGATHLKTHHTAASLLKKWRFPDVWPHERQPELKSAHSLRRTRPLHIPFTLEKADE